MSAVSEPGTFVITLMDGILMVIYLWLLLGVIGLLAAQHGRVAQFLFPCGGVLGLVLAGCGLAALFAVPTAMILPIGLPGLPFHLRLDSLSALFLLIIGGVSAGVSFFSAGYFRSSSGQYPGLLTLAYYLFLASMALLMLADDAYAFMVLWESMALTSFLLVTTYHQRAEVRAAGFLYLLLAHVGAVAILLCFGVMQADSGDYTFANLRAQSLDPFWASVAFAFALFGFGAKAGIVPLHVWLPEAHPAAPSPVSALMSGVMLKTAIYGLLRVTFDLLPMQLWWWGVVLLALGLGSALFGVVFAAVQTDMKRLLAYSSIENIGVVFAGLGLTVLFSAYTMHVAAALALTATLYHALSHAFFKGLLFLGTGAVLHSTAERNLGKLGGLIRHMPWVAWITLIGALTSAGLPPLGGFVAEWLLLQSFLFTPALPNSFLNMLIPVVAASIALVAALAGYTMVKFFGVIFLGQPREQKLAHAHDTGRWERFGMLWLAVGCIALGLFPAWWVQALDPVTRYLVGAGLGEPASQSMWLLIPFLEERASYGPLLFLLGIAISYALAFLLVRGLYHGRLRRAAPWDCGFPAQNERMQDTAEGFGQPIRRVFDPLFRVHRTLPTPFDRHPHYQEVIADPVWHHLYLPLSAGIEWLGRHLGRLQQGRIAIYLLYSFLTLIAVLLVARL